MKQQAALYFPRHYEESRQRFIRDAKQIPQARVGRWHVPSKVDADLSVDYTWLAPTQEPKTLVVMLSGIHGSETYAGSAILNLFMNEMLGSISREHIGILMVHAMNPYGFKYHHRCTENHVNLNRNFSVSGKNFSKKNPDSHKMHERFHTYAPVADEQCKLMRELRREGNQIFFADVSVDQLTKAIAPGQYEHPENVEYGGTQLEPQTQAVIQLVGELMPAYQDVIGLDLHTGLGHRGRLHLLTDGGASLHPGLLKQLIRPDEDKEFYEFTPPETEGFYQVYGASNSMFGELAQKHQRVCAITMEFGTLGLSLDQQIQGLNAFMIEHQGHMFGYANEDLEKKIRDQNFERFNPSDEQWRQDILRATEGFLSRVFQRIS